jgi:hypothetical protein
VGCGLVYRTLGGKVLQGKDVIDDRGGYDLAIVTLDARVDDAEPAPLLHS